MCKFFYIFAPIFKTSSMRRLISLIMISACLSMYCVPAFGWGQEGHRIIAKIAYDHLGKKAKKQVDAVLGTRGIIYWANWPDEIKSDTIYPQSIKTGWHYQDFDPGMSDSLVADALIHYPADGGNLFRAMDSLIAIKDKDEHVMRFIVHLSGDRYCPMHLAHKDDKGGNAVKMKWFSNHTNLHAVWDTWLIDSQGYSYTEYAQMIEDVYGAERRAIEQATDKDLLLHTYHLTDAIYTYQQTWDGNTYHYIYRWHRDCERQLYIAGIRLAQLLNRIYQ